MVTISMNNASTIRKLPINLAFVDFGWFEIFASIGPSDVTTTSPLRDDLNKTPFNPIRLVGCYAN